MWFNIEITAITLKSNHTFMHVINQEHSIQEALFKLIELQS